MGIKNWEVLTEAKWANTFFSTTGLDPRAAGKQFSGLALLREKIPVYCKKKKKSVGGAGTTDFKSFGFTCTCVYSVAMNF